MKGKGGTDKKFAEIPIEFNPGFVQDNIVFEQVEGNRYIIYDLTEKKFVVNSSDGQTFETNETTYFPLPKIPWPLCTLPMLNLNHAELWRQTRQYIIDHLDLPEKPLYDVLTSWIFATWTPERWTVVPYLFFYGPVASGKTRALEVLQKICYRGILGSNVSSAALFRGVEKWHPTVFLDETEIYSREHRAEIIGLLNSGYRRGQYAWRVKSTDHGQELELFDVFGFKALAGTEGLRDTLESRSIVVNMMKNVRPVNFLVDEENALELRNKLLTWRLQTLSDISDVSDVFPDIPPPLKFADGRLVELFFSLYKTANEGQENIVEYARKVYEKRLEIEETSLEAEVLRCIVDYGSEVENQFIETKAIANLFNESREEREKWKTTSVGRLIRRLGLDTKRGSGGKRGWKWDTKRIDYLKKRYGVEGTLETTSLTSQTSPDPFHPTCWLCRETIQLNEPFKPYEGKQAHLKCIKKLEDAQQT